MEYEVVLYPKNGLASGSCYFFSVPGFVFELRIYMRGSSKLYFTVFVVNVSSSKPINSLLNGEIELRLRYSDRSLYFKLISATSFISKTAR